jgi:peptidoglycan/LPS O-acetylase OafA/YrhL
MVWLTSLLDLLLLHPLEEHMRLLWCVLWKALGSEPDRRRGRRALVILAAMSPFWLGLSYVIPPQYGWLWPWPLYIEVVSVGLFAVADLLPSQRPELVRNVRLGGVIALLCMSLPLMIVEFTFTWNGRPL